MNFSGGRVDYLQGFVGQLLVSPLLQFDVHSGVEGAGVHGLGGR